jgi:hypothetical protein
VSEKLKEQVAAAAIEQADVVASDWLESDLGPPMQGKPPMASVLASSSAAMTDGSHFESTSFHYDSPITK